MTDTAPVGGASPGYLDQVDIDGDRELVDRFQLGDETAFAELYSRHYRRLYRSCLRYLGDPATAEDAVQEAFARALRALPTFHGDRRFYPWLSVIAKRVCLDIHRHRARSQPADSIDLGASPDGEQAVLRSMEATAVQDALARLSSRHQDVLRLREYEGWSYRRIASHYDVRVATVEALLWRARRALHRQLTMAGYERRALVGLPVAGWAYRKAVSIRVRLGQLGGGRLAPALGSAASVVTIGALVLGASGTDVHDVHRQTAVVSHAPPAAAPTPPMLPGSVPTPLGRPALAVPAGLPTGPAVDPPAARVSVGSAPVLGATFSNASAASQQARQAPVHVSTAGVTAGLNPRATASGVAGSAATTVDQLRRSIP